MSNYKFTFGYLALKMLGKTLYSNPFAALSELIANGFDAKADKVWVYIDIREKRESEIVVIDNGSGMTDADIINKYLQVGKDNRASDDNIMMGRKGIGKLAAFYLSNKYFLSTKTQNEKNFFEIDFTLHEQKKKNVSDDTYMTKIHECKFPHKEIYENNISGTALYLTQVNFVGYGEKSFEVLESELAEMFIIKNNQKKIYLKIVRSDKDLDNNFIIVQKKVAFKNMSRILYNLQKDEFEKVIALNGKEIINSEKEDSETKYYTEVQEYKKHPRESVVDGKKIQINPKGWIGIHQTINRKKAHLNDPQNFLDNKYYHFNKVRIYVRGKLALENILPFVHNTQYYVNYIEGELQCDELDDNDFPDIASSSRQDIDKNDDRFMALVDYVKEIVNSLVKFKNDQTNEDLKRKRKKQENAVQTLTLEIESSLTEKIGENMQTSDIEDIKHSILNSFERVQDSLKTEYVVFLSHRRENKEVSDFIFNYLISVCGFEEEFIFYTSKPGGVNQSIDVLEKQVNDTLTNKNTYVIFCIGSKTFMESQYCMFEGGAAWATKQKDVIGLLYTDYKENVPEYLKNMKNFGVNFTMPDMNRDLYISIVRLLNSIIEYLNRNYAEESSKKLMIAESSLPDEVELRKMSKTVDEFYNKDVVKYWELYVLNK